MNLVKRGYKFCQSTLFQGHQFQNLTFQTKNTNQNLEQIVKAFQSQGVDVSYCKQIQGKQKNREINISIPKQTQHFMENMNDSFRQMSIQMKKDDPIQVQWFPTSIDQLDLVKPQILDLGENFFEQSQAGQDQEYRKRLEDINFKARNNKLGELIDNIQYNEKEEEVWKYLINRAIQYHKDVMCQEYNENIDQMKKQLNVVERIPQLQNVSEYLQHKTGFRLKPTVGITSQRAFLNALAFKVFHSTQYIRHHSNPNYSFFPDLFHEVVGHVCMLGHPMIAKYSELLGLASLGASDERISQLGTLYLFILEFGFIMENGKPCSYGAGPAACIDEMIHIRSKNARFKPLEPEKDCRNPYPIMQVQPLYYYTSDLMETLHLLQKFCVDPSRPFNPRLSKDGKSIVCDRDIKFKKNI